MLPLEVAKVCTVLLCRCCFFDFCVFYTVDSNTASAAVMPTPVVTQHPVFGMIRTCPLQLSVSL